MGLAKAMPNWIPVLLVLLTQGASGSIATVHPHDMVRMIQLVAQWEESTAEPEVSNFFLASKGKSDYLLVNSSNPIDVVVGKVQKPYTASSDLTRDGPTNLS